MSSLVGLWLVSLALSGIAIAIMCGLILGRWLSTRRSRSREAERRRLVPLLLAASPSEAEADAPSAADNLLTDLACELIQLVRGSDRAAFVASATRLGVPLRLRQRLTNASPRVRLTAAEALADFGDEDSHNSLLEALEDRNADVRLSAALALAASQRAPQAATLIEKLRIGRGENSMLIVGLFREIAAQSPDQIKQLVLDKATPAPIKAAAIDALSASGDYSLVPAIVDLVLAADEDAQELPRYVKALGDFGHPAARPAMVRGLTAQSWWIRATAAEAAGRIGLTDLSPMLTSLLDDAHWWVRFRAGEALVQLGEAGHEQLRVSMLTGSELARSTAALTMAERGIPA